MACEIIGLDQSGNCINAEGGIVASYVTECENITDVAVGSDGEITGITMSAVGLWEKFIYDDDDSAFFNREGERTNTRHVFNETAFMKFAGLDSTKMNSANGLVQCCCLVAVHEMSSGVMLVQGIDTFKADTSWKLSKKKVKAVVNGNTDTGENEDRLEINLESQSRRLSYTTLDGDAIEAL